MAKTEHWAVWLEGIDELSLWTASRLVTGPASDGGRSRVPMLQVKDPITKTVRQEEVNNKSKGHMFFDTFFPPRPVVSMVNPDFEYPAPAWKFECTTNEQIHHTIKRMKPYKAMCSQTIPNLVLVYG
jgi:hypothetical protein